ncbi:hypothetical protein Nepgr_017935 [Nepenthes gracilis]|uniref:RING-type E3 ubiquitin transferase n=1 Tax=Nepenthes gracilis TaxID=150966 RepID=A0AAD3XTK6_NEPGR|nr:hypothetical protein Nepgr_017935 [Nepenthes gracilis]
MSSDGPFSSGAGGGAAGSASFVPRVYFCYQCNRTVHITPSQCHSELVCPYCNGGFLEEVRNHHSATATSNPFFSFSSSSDHLPTFAAAYGTGAYPSFFPSSSSPSSSAFGNGAIPHFVPASSHSYVTGLDPSRLSTFSGDGRSTYPDPNASNRFPFMQYPLQNMRASGANFQPMINSSHYHPGFHPPANVGDHFIDPRLEQIVQHLVEIDSIRHGTPPASKSAVEALPSINVTEELLESDSSQCVVCKDEFHLGVEIKQMPCKHVYHPHCILPWLRLHNTCPVCRYQLPTDGPVHERRRENTVSSTAAAYAAGHSGSNGDVGGYGGHELSPESSQFYRPAERRFRTSFPWLFRPPGSQAVASSNGGDISNGDNNRDSNSGNTENLNFGSETKQEELD